MFKGSVLIVAFATVGFIVTSCGINPSIPTPAQLVAADYGAVPTQQEPAIRKYFDDTLKDPASVQYREITAPEKGFVRKTAPISGINTFVYGWLVKANVNAKNAYGGYVGFKTYSFIFRGDEIVNVESAD